MKGCGFGMSVAAQSGSQVGNITIIKGQPDEIKNLNLSQLVNFKDHPFHVESNTELFALMQSIEKDGLLIPLLARPNPHGEGYELISGHRRKAACEWAGVTEVPVIIRNLNDCEAVIATVDSNLQREHLKPREGICLSDEAGGDETAGKEDGFNFLPSWQKVRGGWNGEVRFL